MAKQQSCNKTKPTADKKDAICASFYISELIAKEIKPFSDGEFVKDCINILVKNVCPEKK